MTFSTPLVLILYVFTFYHYIQHIQRVQIKSNSNPFYLFFQIGLISGLAFFKSFCNVSVSVPIVYIALNLS